MSIVLFMTENERKNKNKRIAESYARTKQKRGTQMPITLELKVNYGKCNKAQKTFLKMSHVECKWAKNWLINKMEDVNFDIFKFEGKELDVITHKTKEGKDETVKLSYIRSSVKDSVVEDIRNSIRSLRAKKKKGLGGTGKLKFVSDYPSIELKQYGVTHHIEGKNRIKVQGCKKPLPVNGLKQLRKFDALGIEYDLTTAKLNHKDDDYYIYLTVYVDKEQYKQFKNSKKNIKVDKLGLDFGCENTLTSSEGWKENVLIEESERLKRLQRKRNKMQKGSNNRYRLGKLIRKEYYKLTCKKNEAANQLCAKIKKHSGIIVIQDEQISSWKHKHGKKIQHGILGRIK